MTTTYCLCSGDYGDALLFVNKETVDAILAETRPYLEGLPQGSEIRVPLTDQVKLFRNGPDPEDPVDEDAAGYVGVPGSMDNVWYDDPVPPDFDERFAVDRVALASARVCVGTQCAHLVIYTQGDNKYVSADWPKE